MNGEVLRPSLFIILTFNNHCLFNCLFSKPAFNATRPTPRAKDNATVTSPELGRRRCTPIHELPPHGHHACCRFGASPDQETSETGRIRFGCGQALRGAGRRPTQKQRHVMFTHKRQFYSWHFVEIFLMSPPLFIFLALAVNPGCASPSHASTRDIQHILTKVWYYPSLVCGD